MICWQTQRPILLQYYIVSQYEKYNVEKQIQDHLHLRDTGSTCRRVMASILRQGRNSVATRNTIKAVSMDPKAMVIHPVIMTTVSPYGLDGRTRRITIPPATMPTDKAVQRYTMVVSIHVQGWSSGLLLLIGPGCASTSVVHCDGWVDVYLYVQG